jgi:hypothetical protein
VQETLPAELVVVIDALDECENKESTARILDVLLTKTSNLPIKFFVSSRPEPEIREQMADQHGDRASARLVLHELDKGAVQADIETYLRVALAPMNPSDSQISVLVERAGILFIYAATAVRYIGQGNFRRNPRARLETVLSMSISTERNKNKEIDQLYTTILGAAFNDPDLDVIEGQDMKLVLNTVICAREPLTIETLAGLLKVNDTERVHTALRPLWSVLYVVEASELVTPLHASFPDYMFDPGRSKEYYCDATEHNHTLALLCFDSIGDTKPQFNVCRLESSYVPDEHVVNLKERVDQVIPAELFYACRYWAAHLNASDGSPALIKRLEEFLSIRLLLWIEVLNLKKSMGAGAGVVQLAENWSIVSSLRTYTLQISDLCIALELFKGAHRAIPRRMAICDNLCV